MTRGPGGSHLSRGRIPRVRRPSHVTSTPKDARRLLVTATRHGAPRALTLGLVSTSAAAATLLLPAVLGRALDVLLANGGGDGGGAGRWLLLSTVLSLAAVLLDAADTVLTGTLNSRTTAWLRTRLVHHLLSLAPARARRFSDGDLVTRGTANAAHAGNAPSAAASTLAALALPLGGIAALALLDLRLAAVFLVGAPLLGLVLRAFLRTTSDCVARYQEEQGRIAGRLVEVLGGARTVAAARTYGRERDRILGPLPALSAQGHRMWRVQGRSTAQAAVLVPLLQVGVVAVGGLLVAHGELSVGGLVAAARYAVLAAGIGGLVGHLEGLVRSTGAARRLHEVHAEPPFRHGSGGLPEGPGRLELRGVRAVRGGTAVLDGVDLTVPGGATVAVVGRSGAGKSLLAALAGRLEDPDEGSVLLDGVDLATLDRDALRHAVGYAFERPALLGGTLGGTIALGPRNPGPGPERIRKAARAACADGFVRTLPEGYATPCARARLSGGEVQRLGLARAFAHDGRLLILDDATSSLDTATELRVSGTLLGPGTTRTRLVVAHRASTAARSDLTVWLDDGRVRALGPHALLWAEHPAYRRLFAADGEED
ncbi:ABC transporter ATP-binding protein [Streptomyces sp. NPDC048172]|uniref:ABC transporter ATP-binding protein n=1 Tax=Streptomyces sp. NPDC048172 TaxID=3365505 RepID=UPI003710DE7E